MAKKQQKPQRGKVTVRMALVDNYSSLETLQSIIDDVRKRMEIEPFEDVSIEYETTTGYYNDVSVEMVITGIRAETDEEYNMRLANEERARENRRDWERQEYERLKAKFEKGG